MAVGFWNFTGAGVFGFLINMPIVSYFEAGTNLTPNHGHAAMMGVFGMLGVALMVFVLRETVQESLWPRLEKYVRCGFWGLNIGLAMMILFSLFPSGVLQVRDVLENGYWHARSLAYLGGELPRLLELAKAAGRPGLYLPGRAADTHRRWARLFEPVVGAAASRGGAPG
jgi:nitric oxide reductase subunit B